MTEKLIKKRDGSMVAFDSEKIRRSVSAAYESMGQSLSEGRFLTILDCIRDSSDSVERVQDAVERALMQLGDFDVAKSYILYRERRSQIRRFAQKKMDFINRYKKTSVTADATVDDNSNVGSRNIGVVNSEIHKEDNIQISRAMVTEKLKELWPDFDHKSYARDLESHIIYKNDESSFAGAIAPYCCAITMYPFLTDGLRKLGGLSAAPKNIDSFCGMYINLVFAISAMFSGAVATPEFLLYFDYFARKEWGNDYWKGYDREVSSGSTRKKTVRDQIHQYWQQVIYSINQPAAARGMQSAFVNFSYYDEPFFHGMFGDFRFPDGSAPKWESLDWLQKEYMQWFNEERLKCILTFPVESATLIYKDGDFIDKAALDFVCEEYARGHSFFTYISDTVDSLCSCCRLRSAVDTKEFSYTNGNMGVQTGSKSVITLNLNRIIQNYMREKDVAKEERIKAMSGFKDCLIEILERVYKYHTAYNELLWDMYDADLLPAYNAGFIDLNRQYLTIGLNGLNQAAEFVGFTCSDNDRYAAFCRFIFSIVKEQNRLHRTKKTMFNTEQVPAESLAVKNYNWDKADGYWVPDDTNLYASYIFKPNDGTVSVLDKLRMHGSDYIGRYLDGGAAAHINLSEHLTAAQYKKLLYHAAENGCQYLTFNVPNSECRECGLITKHPIYKCPRCGSEKIDHYDRIIGYLTKISNWSQGRKDEQKLRVYSSKDKM